LTIKGIVANKNIEQRHRRANMMALDKLSQVLNQVLMWIAGVFLVAMVVLTCANVFLRVVWMPVRGTFEIMGFLGAIVTAFALGYTQIERGHIAVDILIKKFSKKAQRIANSITCLICMVFFSMAAWQIAKWASTLRKSGEVTETLQIVYYPFTYGVALGCVVLALVFLVDLMKAIVGEEEKDR
jgi:TRAP-type C4-dicarboxylate transport system permease small subunit